jgi:hypothetical protein
MIDYKKKYLKYKSKYLQAKTNQNYSIIEGGGFRFASNTVEGITFRDIIFDGYSHLFNTIIFRYWAHKGMCIYFSKNKITDMPKVLGVNTYSVDQFISLITYDFNSKPFTEDIWIVYSLTNPLKDLMKENLFQIFIKFFEGYQSETINSGNCIALFRAIESIIINTTGPNVRKMVENYEKLTEQKTLKSSQASHASTQASQASQTSTKKSEEDIKIDPSDCTKFRFFKKKKIETREIFDQKNFGERQQELEGYNYDKIICMQKFGKELGKQIGLFYELINLLVDNVQFFKIFGVLPFEEKTIVDNIIKDFYSFDFKFDRKNFDSFFLTFLNSFFLNFIKEIVKLLTKVLSEKYDKIIEINLEKHKYLALKFVPYEKYFHKKSFISFLSLIVSFVQPYGKIFLILTDFMKIYNFTKKMDKKRKITFKEENSTSSLKGEYSTSALKGEYSTSALKDVCEKIFEYHDSFNELMAQRYKRFRQPILPLCDIILDLLLKTKCAHLQNMITLFKNNIGNKNKNNEEILEEFYRIINFFITDDFSCINPKIKLDVYKLLKQIGDIFIFIEPDKKPIIKQKFVGAFNKLSMIQRTQQSKNEEIDINKLKELIINLEEILIECNDKDLLIGNLKNFKDNLNFLNITQGDITNLSEFEKFVDSKSYFICYNKEGKKNIKPKIKIKLKNIKDTLIHLDSIKSSQSLPSRSTSPPKSRSTSPPSREPPPIPLFVN